MIVEIILLVLGFILWSVFLFTSGVGVGEFYAVKYLSNGSLIEFNRLTEIIKAEAKRHKSE